MTTVKPFVHCQRSYSGAGCHLLLLFSHALRSGHGEDDLQPDFHRCQSRKRRFDDVEVDLVEAGDVDSVTGEHRSVVGLKRAKLFFLKD